MPAALTTTKRKFHKILDSISNASSTSLPPRHDRANESTTNLSETFESPAKKLRPTRPASAYVSSSASRHVTSHSRNTSGASKLSDSSAMTPEHKPPNFAPWDRGQFLERLGTFRHVDKWMPKSESIDEVQWAKRGWTCVGKERVGCVGGCGKEVVITLESSRVNDEERKADEEDSDEAWREDAQEQLVGRYAEMIVTEHEGGCRWRRRGCDATIQRLPLAHQATALDNLHDRYESLQAISSSLPDTLSTPPTLNLETLATQTRSVLSTTSTHPPINPTAIALALFGWQSTSAETTTPALATCTACFRRLGFWLFTSPTTPTTTSPSVSTLDPIAEHRHYCPWRNPLSQSRASITTHPTASTPDLAGWEILLQVITNALPHASEESPPPVPPKSNDTPQVTVHVDDDVASEVVSVVSPNREEDTALRDEKDRERWAKLRRLRRVFTIGSRKGRKAKEAGAA